MNRLPLPRIMVLGNRPPSGGWALEKTVGEDGERMTALIACPGCQGYSGIQKHSIDRKGNVMPSIVCELPIRYRRSQGSQISSKPCTFHEFVYLADWPENMEKKAGEEFVTVLS